MANNRIFYACQAVAIRAPHLESNLAANFNYELHGVQSVGITTNFNLEQVFELGQIQIYENAENIPEIEVTLEKVLDGYPLLYTSATAGAGTTKVAANNSLVNRSAQRCDLHLGIYDESNDVVGGGLGLQAEVAMPGMYINSVSYTIPTDGPCTESITLVGNDKTWQTPANLIHPALANNTIKSQFDFLGANGLAGQDNKGDDLPLNSNTGSNFGVTGGIQRRENVVMGSCWIPLSVLRAAAPAINHAAIGGNNIVPNGGGANYAHIQSISISADFGRENILELGRKAPYYRSANFPIEVTCDIEVISTVGDWVSAYEEGNTDLIGTKWEGDNTREETIIIVLEDGTTFNLGAKNRLSSVTYGGGDASGGNSTMTFSFTTFNDLSVLAPQGGDY